jgi:hypothetical protein
VVNALVLAVLALGASLLADELSPLLGVGTGAPRIGRVLRALAVILVGLAIGSPANPRAVLLGCAAVLLAVAAYPRRRVEPNQERVVE